MTLELDRDFGWVILVIAASHLMNFYLVMNVIRARKKYGCKYPTLYMAGTSKKAVAFNCVQRAHQNTLENWAGVQIMMIVNGLVNPLWAARFGGIWVAGRFLYGHGYAQGADGRRLGGVISHLGDFPLIGMTFHTALSLVGWI